MGRHRPRPPGPATSDAEPGRRGLRKEGTTTDQQPGFRRVTWFTEGTRPSLPSSGGTLQMPIPPRPAREAQS
jgi:hypothetical protein